MYYDLRGQRFGRLTVKNRSFDDASKWDCVCDCGNSHQVRTSNLSNGHIRSCGCLREDNSGKTTHGLSGTPEYHIWVGMFQRCTNPGSVNYHDYGGRGITVCERWMNSFENFLADMGPRPSDEYSIDRFPNGDGPYEPGNCRWATRVEQNSNRRGVRVYKHEGVMYTAPELAARYGITNIRAFGQRLVDGWDTHRAITTPIYPRPNRGPND